jgi:tetratricopeptide (TPR) repeat protein
VREAAGITDTDDLETRRSKLRARVARTVGEADALRVAAFLGEMIGTTFSESDVPALAAARRDPLLMNAAMTAAWVDWLRAETKRRPVLLVLEDLHWGDLVSVKLVDVALQRLAEAPLFVLCLARPEVKSSFPQLFASSGLVELRLDALSRKASRELVREVLGEGASDEAIERIVERSGGNAFFLEELIRTIADGDSETLPDTVLGIVQSRLDALGDDVKRVLRAASIFGEVFTVEGVEALVGKGGGPFRLREWLDDLVAKEIIGHHGTSGRGGELKFRHALVRDAAYAMLTEQDRTWGHRLAAEWLESSSKADPLLLAEQFVRGDLPLRAVRWFRRAAEQALDGRDLDAVRRHAQRAIDAGASDDDLAAAYHLQAVASYWQSRYAEAQRQAASAARLFVQGSSEWFRAVAEAVVSSARLGDFDTLDRWFDRAASAEPSPGAAAAQLVCLCRGTFQMIFAGRFAASDTMLARIASVARAPETLDDLARAQLFHVQGLRAAHAGDVATFLARLEAAVAAFERAGDLNNVRLERTTIGWCWAEIGDFEKAEHLVRANIDECIRAGAQQAITYAKVNLGYILAHRSGKSGEARELLASAIEECRAVGNSRLEGWAHAHVAAIEHAAGNDEKSLEHAEDAVRLLAAAPSLHGWALATRARALLAFGRPEVALDDAKRAMQTLESLGGLLQGESLPPLVIVEVLRALERNDDARRAAARARERLERRAERLSRPEWRSFFLAIPDNAATMRL